MRAGPEAGRYTVRRWSGLVPWAVEVGTVLAVGVVLGLAQDRLAVNLLTGAVAVVLGVLAFDRATLAFRADATGVTWARPVPRLLLGSAGIRRLPWTSIEDLEVTEDRSVRATLRADAPLPGWMTGRAVDLARPDASTVVEGEARGVRAEGVRSVAFRAAPQVSVRG